MAYKRMIAVDLIRNHILMVSNCDLLYEVKQEREEKERRLTSIFSE